MSKRFSLARRHRRTPQRRWLGRVLMATATARTTAGGLIVTTPRPAAADTNSDAAALAQDINAIRAWFHLPALAVNPALSNFALAHSQQMAASGTIFHTASLWSVAALVPGWSLVGENVGTGPSEPTVAYALAHSAEHLRNMLGAYDQMGIGVAYRGAAIYVTEEFAQAPL
jgi:uncharacterized protein YkwD